MIVPLGVLAELGYAIHWEGVRFEMTDPAGCTLDTALENGCPTVTEELGLELIQEVERRFAHQRARLAVLRGEGSPGNLDQAQVKDLEELRRMFPEVPERILVRILPSQLKKPEGEDLPWNRRRRRRMRQAKQLIVHLFSGNIEKYWMKERQAPGREVLCVDTEIDKRQDLLCDHIMNFLLELADSGVVEGWLGGPPCRTMSRLRYRAPGPPPVRTE